MSRRASLRLFFRLAIEPGPGIDRWNRIANVWTLPESSQEAALRSFLARAASRGDRPGEAGAILVAGDSQLYGYFLPAPRTAAARLAEELPWASVYNSSRIAGNPGWARLALEAAIDAGLAPRVLVVNANPATQGDTGRARERTWASRSLLASLVRAHETTAMAADVLRARMRAGAPPFDPYDLHPVPPGNGSYQVTALARDYYPQQMPAYVADSWRTLLGYARGKVDLVVVVASPHHYAPYNEAPFRYGWDTAPVVREAMAICAEYAHAACLDLSTAYGREYFHDVVHLNENGHRRLAEEIAAADPSVLDKIRLGRGRRIDGHAPGVTGKDLGPYVGVGIKSDHECTTPEEALEKLRAGMHVFIREGSAARNLDAGIGAVTERNHASFSFCTDDRDPLEILDEGHIDHLVRRAIARGVDPVLAVRIATINSARYLDMRSMGAVAPGYKADLVLVDDLRTVAIHSVVKNGRVVARGGIQAKSPAGAE